MLAVAWLTVLVVLGGMLAALVQVSAARQRAGTAADLAALAAASAALAGPERACARAGRVARAQGTRLVRCTVLGGRTADVAVSAGRAPYRVTARSRAAAG